MIADFGVTSEGMTQKTTVRARGSPGYRAPELIGWRHAAYSKESDIWSLGCILYELAYGKAAFTHDFAVFNFESIEELPTPDIGSHSGFTDALRVELLTPMLEPEYTNRPPARRLAESLAWCLPCISDGDYGELYLNLEDCVIGTDGPMSQVFPRWDDLFLPGHYQQHSAMFERYERVSKARDAVLGEYHPASIWSASRVAWGHFHRCKEDFRNVCNDETLFDDDLWVCGSLFDDLADRQVYGRFISPADQKMKVLATDLGAALSFWDCQEDRISRLRDLIVAYRSFATEMQTPLNIDVLRAESYLQNELLYNCYQEPDERRALARLWNIFSAQTEQLGPWHCDALETLVQIGFFQLCGYGEYEQGKNYLERVKTAGARLGPAHINQARCMYYLASSYVSLSLPLDVTIQQLDMAWEACRVVYGESHDLTTWLVEQRLWFRQILERKQNGGTRGTLQRSPYI